MDLVRPDRRRTMRSSRRSRRRRSFFAPGYRWARSCRSARRRWRWSTPWSRHSPRSCWPNSPLIPAGVAILSLVLFAYSIAGTRKIIATGRKRLELEAQARKALHFVDEFENSGRGWFWETNSLGTLSYVSRAARRGFPVRAGGAARPPVHRPAVGRQPLGRRHRGAQDARLPPVRALPLLRRGRPPGERAGRPLVAVGQSDLRRPRPLPRLPRDRHRPHRAAPLRAGDYPPRPVRTR